MNRFISICKKRLRRGGRKENGLVRRARRGSIITDAAICVPVFIIAISALLMLIAQCGIEDTVFRAECYAAELSSESEGSKLVYAAAYKSYIADEWSSRRASLDYVADGLDGRIRAKASSDMKLLFSRASAEASNELLYRPFIGASEKRDYEEEEQDDPYVYVFPKAGERYHCAGCSILRNGGVQQIMTASSRRSLKPCKNCDPGYVASGSSIYVGSSGIYHRKDCSSITKVYVCMHKSEAESAGYTPCHICGGVSDD